MLEEEDPEVLSLLGKSSLLNGGAIPLAMGWALSWGLLRARSVGQRFRERGVIAGNGCIYIVKG